jgi:branched-chain amino acid transport system permease protein
MSYILQNLVIALNEGSTYALIALGYTMVYGVLRMINFAHGDVFMIGAFVGAYMARWLNPPTGPNPSPDQLIWHALVGVLASMIICGVIGFVIERLAYRPLRKSPKLASLITAIGVSLLIEYLAQIQWTVGGQTFFGPTPQRYQSIQGTGAAIPFFQNVFGISVVWKDIIVISTTLVTLVGLRFIVLHTRIGKAMRAVSMNYDAARLMGINIDRVISFTFVLGSALAAIGGCLYGMTKNQCTPLMGLIPGLKAFVAAVIGGIGNIPGAAVGGLILGLIETFVATVQYDHKAILYPYRDAIAFLILILVLLIKPEGIFGKAVPEKV